MRGVWIVLLDIGGLCVVAVAGDLSNLVAARDQIVLDLLQNVHPVNLQSSASYPLLAIKYTPNHIT